jgi:hypothetical protein
MSARNLLRLCLGVLAVPLYALYGAWSIASGAVRLARRGSGALRLLGRALPCPSCRAPNPLHGRWKCRSCSATYHGFALECPLCGSGASFVACARCGISVPVGKLLA